MPLRYDTVTFLSDYGHTDEFVGVVKSVIRSIAPDVTVVDLTHEIAPHDVRAAGLALARSAQYLVPGVVLGVVDPGVGGPRRAVAIEVGGGQSVLVGPDNGLFAPAVAMVGGAGRAVVLTNDEYHLPAPGPTFAGRDVFAPAVAHLCTGTELTELGDLIDPHTLLPGVIPISRLEEGVLHAEVLWIDRFGNAQLNVDPDELDAWGDRVDLRAGERSRRAVRAATYAEVPPGSVGLVVDSYGLVSVTVDRGSAAAELGLRAGDQVTLEPLDDDTNGALGDAGAVTSVQLGARRGGPIGEQA
jgi:S-adenosylmethionine hydrolase